MYRTIQACYPLIRHSYGPASSLACVSAHQAIVVSRIIRVNIGFYIAPDCGSDYGLLAAALLVSPVISVNTVHVAERSVPIQHHQGSGL